MLHANEAQARTNDYFTKAEQASQEWLAEHVEKASMVVASEAAKGMTVCTYKVLFGMDLLALARTNMLVAHIEKYGYYVSTYVENTHTGQGSVLKDTYTCFNIQWGNVLNETV